MGRTQSLFSIDLSSAFHFLNKALHQMRCTHFSIQRSGLSVEQELIVQIVKGDAVFLDRATVIVHQRKFGEYWSPFSHLD